MEIFLLTCILMFRLFSPGSANSMLFLDPPRFNIERKVNLETTVSCGRDMFQAERVLTCGLFANQGKKFFISTNFRIHDNNNQRLFDATV